MNENCVFCKIVSKQIPSHIVFEDENHIAFLGIFPNTDGMTIVTTKKHLPSYFAQVDDTTLKDLILATKKVAKKLDIAFDDVERTGLIFEGFGVDHLHAKLYPMHQTKNQKVVESKVNKFFTKYEGYLSSHDYSENGQMAKTEYLAQIAKKINKINQH